MVSSVTAMTDPPGPGQHPLSPCRNQALAVVSATVIVPGDLYASQCCTVPVSIKRRVAREHCE